MNTYPTTLPAPSVGSTHTVRTPVIRSDSEANYPSTRRRHSRVTEKWSLEYSVLTFDEYEILRDFFEANQGLAFLYTPENSTVAKTVIFDMDELEDTPYGLDTRDITVKLLEI